MLDKEMYVKVLEREIIDSIADFLDKHNIDTSDFKDKATAIVNNGIFVQGGNIQANAIAVGAKAKAKAETNKKEK
ncbi:MAG: hypothetical protein HQL61_11775 [Magnetococcales bacterium]|nr:hypothetical protein [Nitrospirota bacterium]